jgi:hypothetical protein
MKKGMVGNGYSREGGIVKRPCDDLGRSSSEQALGSRRESAGSPIVTPRAQPFQ